MKKKHGGAWMALILFTLLLSGTVTVHSTAEVHAAAASSKKAVNKFVTKKGVTYYYGSDGKPVKSWKTIGGKKYFFNKKTGAMKTGWDTTTAGKYYFGTDGAMRTGWQKISGQYYYFSSKGVMTKNTFASQGSSNYYLNSAGVRQRGRIKIHKYWYAFNRNTGKMIKNGWYKETDGSYYYASSTGRLKTGFYKPDVCYRYFRTSDGKMLTGWQNIGKYRYYLKLKNGLRYDNCNLSIGGKLYSFSNTGKMHKNGWVKRGSKYYYAQSDGSLARGWLSLSGNTYYMNTKYGFRQTGWVTVSGKKYYLEPSTGILAKNKWIDDDHYVGAGGAWNPDYEGTSFRWPLSSKWSYITSYFGNRESPGGIGSTNHKGIDIAATTGTPIYAAAAGTVAAVQTPSQSGGAGNYTVIEHGDGIRTEYMHQSKFASGLRVGARVKKGQVIGYVGSTGDSTGPHLHLGFIVNGVRVNPLNYVRKPS